MKAKIGLVILVATLMVAGAQAELLATWSFNDTAYASGFDSPLEEFASTFLQIGWASGELWFGTFTENNIGQTFEFNLTTNPDPSFDAFVNEMTDGENSYFEHMVISSGAGVGNGFFSSEASVFGSSPYSLNGIDFAGYTIDSISFTIDYLNTHSGYSDGSYYWSDAHLVGTYTFYGSVIPEPSSAMLILFVGSGGWFVRRFFPAV